MNGLLPIVLVVCTVGAFYTSTFAHQRRGGRASPASTTRSTGGERPFAGDINDTARAFAGGFAEGEHPPESDTIPIAVNGSGIHEVEHEAPRQVVWQRVTTNREICV